MAYNNRYNNPDALPPHAEPSGYGQRAPTNMNNQGPPPPGQRPYGYNNNPPQGGQENWGGQQGPNQGNNWQAPQNQQQQYNQQGQGGQGGQGGYGNQNKPRPQLGFLPPRTAAAPPPQRSEHNDYLWRVFKGVDTNNSNSISERELTDALVNSNYQRFDPTTIQMMIKMFDFDRSGSIDFPEFCSLWNFLNDWRKLFDRFDKDKSGAINYPEFRSAMKDFGYLLSDEFMNFFFSVYVPTGAREISFDLFVQACVNLKRLTDVFKVYDTNKVGRISLSFEQFLAGMLSLQ